jgi:hypothetical protein
MVIPQQNFNILHINFECTAQGKLFAKLFLEKAERKLFDKLFLEKAEKGVRNDD